MQRHDKGIFSQGLLEVSAVARKLSVSSSTVYRLIDDGEIKALRIRKSIRVPSCSLRDYIERTSRMLF